MTTLALASLRIIDVTMGWAGPLATMLLAQAGAEVIKIEACQRPDWFRVPKPPAGVEGKLYEQCPHFNGTNTGKLGITLDLTGSEGRTIFKQLVKIGDVVVENYSSRVMENFGLQYRVLTELNPQIIMVSAPAFGASGPWKDYIGYGQTVEAMSGLTALTGYEGGEPILLNNGGDPLVGLNVAVAILTAFHHRQVTGRGQHVEVSHIEAVTPFLGASLMDCVMNGRVKPRSGNRHAQIAPHGCYRCKGDDRWVAVAVTSDGEWESLCQAIGKPDLAWDERFHTAALRLRNQDELDSLLEEWTSERDQYEVTRLLQGRRIAAGPVLSSADLMSDPHLRERSFFQPLARRHVGTHPHPGVVTKLSQTPAVINKPAPCLGEDNELIFGQLLGMSAVLPHLVLDR